MNMKTILFIFILAQIIGCSSQPLQPNIRTAELTVTYFGKEIKKENPTWTNKTRLKRVIVGPGDKYLIFGAPWCKSCSSLRRVLAEGKLLNKVEFINVDDPWAQVLSQYYNIKDLPTLLVIDQETNVIKIKVGPGPIVIHLLANIK